VEVAELARDPITMARSCDGGDRGQPGVVPPSATALLVASRAVTLRVMEVSRVGDEVTP